MDTSAHPITIDRKAKSIRSDHLRMGGEDPRGQRIDSTNYYLRKDRRPWFGISGEFHYSRCDEHSWDRELGKMKAGGLNVVATYVFWNHHEEIQGRFDWTGRRDLRRFVELCGRHGLLVIVRIGPFDHGEVRNGGLPDWLYGQDFEVRSNDAGYLALARRLYTQIGIQLKGLFWKDGGPIIGTQIENEYQHSASPWEATVGTTNEWLPGGRDGEAHMLTLKALAREVGIETPLYVCTAWGGACTPPGEMLPLWGGYSFQPWIFNDPQIKEHPATPEYIFRDHHNNAIPETYNFAPRYQPEDYPYATCEIGGGMFSTYKYRFQFPAAAVPAMILIKLAGGSNFLGYYMYHGGTNPRGKRVPFLNENYAPKFSYDFQAVLGEWGQARAHYHDLRLVHYFLEQFGEAFCTTKTSLPEGAEAILPTDPTALRWAVRADGHRGFLFVVNFQDHFSMAPKEAAFQLNFRDDVPAVPPIPSLRIPSSGTIPIAKDQFAIFPFHQNLDGLELISATAQMVCRIEADGEPWWFFFAPQGIPSRFVLSGPGIQTLGGEPTTGDLELRAQGTDEEHWDVGLVDGTTVHLAVLSECLARQLYRVEVAGRPVLVLSDALVRIASDPFGVPCLALEHPADRTPSVAAFPRLPQSSRLDSLTLHAQPLPGHLFVSYTVDGPGPLGHLPELRYTMVGERKARVSLPQGLPSDLDDLILVVDYEGDVGNAFVEGNLVHDHFANGDPWEISLSSVSGDLDGGVWGKAMVISIVPVKSGSFVISNTTMAGRKEENQGEFGRIRSVSLRGVRTSWLTAE